MKRKKIIKSSKSKTSFRSKNILLILFFFLVGIAVISKTLATVSESTVLGVQALLVRGGDDSGGDDSGSSSSGSGSSGSGSSGDSGSSSGSSNNSDSSSENSGSLGTSQSSGSSSSSSGSSGSSGSIESTSGSSRSSNSITNTPVPIKTETRIKTIVPTVPQLSKTGEIENKETGTRTKTETKENESKTEVRLSETERIRTRTKDGQTRIDITSGGVKTRLEYRDDRVIIKAEKEDGTEVELEDNTLFKIEDRLAKDNIKIATSGAERIVLQRGSIGAVTELPLSVDLATNTLTVNTPSGTKTVAVLPDQAIRNLLAANVINKLGGKTILDEVNNSSLSSLQQIINLGDKNGIPVYEIAGVSEQKLLGFIPVNIEKEVAVSAETGNVVSTDTSLGDRILDIFSF